LARIAMGIVDRAIEKMRRAQRATEDRNQGAAAASAGMPVRRALPSRKPVRETVPVVTRRIDVDQVKLVTAGLRPPPHEAWQISEQYRQIKRPLIANATGRGATPLTNRHVIMVASALAGEGKTFTAINLAYSIASERDVNVLLVDADAPKPHISKLFASDESEGLMDALQDESLDVESLVLTTDSPGLSVLPIGRRNTQATELLASDRMRTLVTKLGECDPRRIVLLDSPPLLLTTESRALAAIAGQVVLVVCAAQTAQQTLLDALSFLESSRVALVLNRNTRGTQTGYYYGDQQPNAAP
jgi:protein-tyrosine kinase